VLGSEGLRKIADAAPFTCPDCGGVLSQVRGAAPLRFRCQVGHAVTAEVLLREQEDPLRGTMRSAQRLVEEHLELLARMATDARAKGRDRMAAVFDARGDEYRRTAQVIREGLSIPEANNQIGQTVDRPQAAGETSIGVESKLRATQR